jgi:enoyl-CoA hydratase/carnithine racemase
MEYKNIIFEKKENGVARITLNRPEVMNALDATTLEELGAAADDINNDVSVRVVIITAAGKAFCTGADLTAVSVIPEGKPVDYFLRLWHKTFSAIENIGVPVIGMVQGTAYAGGLELTMVCDLVVAAEDAKLSDQHANRGLVPAGGATQRLPRLIGIRKAKELLFLGDRITGAEAEKLGLVNKAVPADKLEEAVDEIVQNFLGKSPMAAKAVKRLVNRGMDGSLETGLQAELLAMTAHGYSEDFKEGIAAFIEKRPAKFPGK